MIDATVKSLISFSYSFLVVFTCPLRNKPCRDVQDCDGFGEGVQHLKMLSAN